MLVHQNGRLQTYTPTLTGSGGNPTLGSGNERYGYYWQIGNLTVVNVRIQVGTTSFANGSGDVICSLPDSMAPAPAGQIICVGNGFYLDTSASDVFALGVISNTATTVKFRHHNVTTPILGYAAPATWGQSDEISFSLFYQNTL